MLLERDWIEDIEGQKGSELADPRSPTLDPRFFKIRADFLLFLHYFSILLLYCSVLFYFDSIFFSPIAMSVITRREIGALI